MPPRPRQTIQAGFRLGAGGLIPFDWCLNCHCGRISHVTAEPAGPAWLCHLWLTTSREFLTSHLRACRRTASTATAAPWQSITVGSPMFYGGIPVACNAVCSFGGPALEGLHQLVVEFRIALAKAASSTLLSRFPRSPFRPVTANSRLSSVQPLRAHSQVKSHPGQSRPWPGRAVLPSRGSPS
jgi:hypothetical protein